MKNLANARFFDSDFSHFEGSRRNGIDALFLVRSSELDRCLGARHLQYLYLGRADQQSRGLLVPQLSADDDRAVRDAKSAHLIGRCDFMPALREGET